MYKRQVQAMGLGKGKDGSETPALYVSGKVSGKEGLFRTDNDGRSWQPVSYTHLDVYKRQALTERCSPAAAMTRR